MTRKSQNRLNRDRQAQRQWANTQSATVADLQAQIDGMMTYLDSYNKITVDQFKLLRQMAEILTAVGFIPKDDDVPALATQHAHFSEELDSLLNMREKAGFPVEGPNERSLKDFAALLRRAAQSDAAAIGEIRKISLERLAWIPTIRDTISSKHNPKAAMLQKKAAEQELSKARAQFPGLSKPKLRRAYVDHYGPLIRAGQFPEKQDVFNHIEKVSDKTLDDWDF